MTTFTRSGNGADPWCDFAPHVSGWMACWTIPGAVQFEDAHGILVSRPVPTDFLRYLDADGNGTEVVAIGVGADDHAYLVSLDGWPTIDLGKVVGNFAVAVFWNGASFVPILVTEADHYTIGGVRKPIPIGATSQGIRQLLNDQIIWGDETHVREVSGRFIHKYSHIGPVFAGQRDGPDHIDLFDGIWHTAIEGSAQPPKMTTLPDGSIGVCAATNHGAVFTIGPPWPSLIPDTQPPDPPDPPVEPDMDFPPDAWAVVEEMHRRFQADFPATEDGARGWTEKTIEQLAFSFPAGGWCWKKSTPTNPPSKDCIARQFEGRFEGWDVLSAAGVTGPRVLSPYPPGYHDLVAEGNQVPIPVTPTNHLGSEPPPVQHVYDGGENDTGICDICGKPKSDPIHIKEPPPPDEGDLAAIKADVAALKIAVSNLNTRVTNLETAPFPDLEPLVREILKDLKVTARNGKTESNGGWLGHTHPVIIDVTLP